MSRPPLCSLHPSVRTVLPYVRGVPRVSLITSTVPYSKDKIIRDERNDSGRARDWRDWLPTAARADPNIEVEPA